MKDYIDREAAINLVDEYFNRTDGDEVISFLREMKAAKVRPVILGEWKKDSESDIVICSNCGEEHGWVDYRASFCEDCGADMRAANQKWYEEQDTLEQLDMSDDED